MKRVVFDLSKLGRLSGYEKITLFQDFLSTNETRNAWQVYQRLQENGIITRVPYKDHFKLFKLLFKQSKKNQTELQLVYDKMKEKSPPTLKLCELMILCAHSWKDVEAALKTLDYIKEQGFRLTNPDVWNALLELLGQFGIAQAQKGLELWEESRPWRNQTSFSHAIHLYLKLGNMDDAKSTFVSGLEQYPDSILLLVRFVQSLMEFNQLDAAKQLFIYFTTQGFLSKTEKSDTALTRELFRCMIQLAHQQGDVEFGEEAFMDMKKRGIRADYKVHCQMLYLYPDINRVTQHYEQALWDIETPLAKALLQQTFIRRLHPHDPIKAKEIYGECVEILREHDQLQLDIT